MLISMLIKWKLANFLKITKFSTNPINDEEHKHIQYANKPNPNVTGNFYNENIWKINSFVVKDVNKWNFVKNNIEKYLLVWINFGLDEIMMVC